MPPVRAFGHQVHPMLIVFPLGLLTTSLVWDVLYLATGNPMWGVVAFWSIVAGLVGGVLAAIPGTLDYLSIPRGTRARRVGALHGLLNVAVLLLFAVSAAGRHGGGFDRPALLDMLPGWLAITLAGASAWLGGELIERLGVGVDRDAGPDARSSLRRPAVLRHLPPTDERQPS